MISFILIVKTKFKFSFFSCSFVSISGLISIIKLLNFDLIKCPLESSNISIGEL